MTTQELQNRLYEFVKNSYPDIKNNVVVTEDGVRQLYFTEKKFEVLYPKQRYHYLLHLIPGSFYDDHLENTQWFELAPNESPNDLNYLDQETVDEIKDIVLAMLKDRSDFVSLLDEKFTSQTATCFGDFRHSKDILTSLGFSTEDQFDIFHVLMNEGGYCDCEILYNVFRDTEYSKKYWQAKQEQRG